MKAQKALICISLLVIVLFLTIPYISDTLGPVLYKDIPGSGNSSLSSLSAADDTKAAVNTGGNTAETQSVSEVSAVRISPEKFGQLLNEKAGANGTLKDIRCESAGESSIKISGKLQNNDELEKYIGKESAALVGNFLNKKEVSVTLDFSGGDIKASKFSAGSLNMNGAMINSAFKNSDGKKELFGFNLNGMDYENGQIVLSGDAISAYGDSLSSITG